MREQIRLSSGQMDLAERVGILRHGENVKAGRYDRITGETSAAGSIGERVHILGAQAEYAVSLFFGVGWSGMFFEDAEWRRRRREIVDVGPFEVRSTSSRTRGLTIYPKDNVRLPYVLVRTYDRPVYYIAGWAYGSCGIHRQFMRGGSSFVIPVERLEPTQSLRRILAGAEPGGRDPKIQHGLYE